MQALIAHHSPNHPIAASVEEKELEELRACDKVHLNLSPRSMNDKSDGKFPLNFGLTFLICSLLSRCFVACLLAMMCLPRTVGALELVGGNINTTAPGTSFNSGTFSQALPWYNVGQLNGDSATYLGDVDGNATYWVITPYHVTASLPATVTFNGIAYNTVAGSYVRLNNFDNSAADLAVFALNVNANPANMVTLTLESTTPAIGTSLYYVGYGGGTKRWGYNTVAGYSYGSDGYGNIAVFSSDYNPGSPNPNEAQAIGGDSGGAAFVYNTLTQSWELGGVMVAVNGNITTYSLDTASYDQQIITAVPEPRELYLLLGGIVGIVGIKFLRRRWIGNRLCNRINLER